MSIHDAIVCFHMTPYILGLFVHVTNTHPNATDSHIAEMHLEREYQRRGTAGHEDHSDEEEDDGRSFSPISATTSTGTSDGSQSPLLTSLSSACHSTFALSRAVSHSSSSKHRK